MEKFDASCLIDAKKEYTQRFVRKLKVPFLRKIMELFSETKDESVNIHEEEKLLIHFQNKLESVPEYSTEKIESLTKSIILETKCDYLEELFQGVYIVHTKILAVIQHHKSNTKSELKIPTIEEFIFQAFVNICRSMWKYAYLFKESKNTCDYQKNTNSIENKIESSITETLEDILPVRELLIEHVKDYIDGENFDDEDEEDDILIQKTKLLKKKKRDKFSGGGKLHYEIDDNDYYPPHSINNVTSLPTTTNRISSIQNTSFNNNIPDTSIPDTSIPDTSIPGNLISKPDTSSSPVSTGGGVINLPSVNESHDVFLQPQDDSEVQVKEVSMKGIDVEPVAVDTKPNIVEEPQVSLQNQGSLTFEQPKPQQPPNYNIQPTDIPLL